jgi:hypothetical protein
MWSVNFVAFPALAEQRMGMRDYYPTLWARVCVTSVGLRATPFSRCPGAILIVALDIFGIGFVEVRMRTFHHRAHSLFDSASVKVALHCACLLRACNICSIVFLHEAWRRIEVIATVCCRAAVVPIVFRT